MFHGALVFFYSGPQASNKAAGRDLDILGMNEPPKSIAKKYGRKAVRAEKTKAEAFERTCDENRGMSTMERIWLSFEAQSDVKQATVMGVVP